MSAPTVSVIFPCLDEAESVAACVRSAQRAFAQDGLSFEVIVADNGSVDGSPELAAEAGARVVTEPRRGYGAAVTAGVAASEGEFVVVADVDGTYPMHQGPDLVRAASEGGIALGSRFAGRIAAGAMPVLHRLVGSPATRLLLRVLFGVRCSDPHSGFRAMRRRVFDEVRPRSDGWEFTVEMLVNAKRHGVAVHEVPIDFGERRGTSKLRALPVGWGFLKFLILHSPTFLFMVPAVAASILGVTLLGWLAPDDRHLGPLTLGVNSLVVGALLTIAGHQIAVLGLAARVHLRRSGVVGLQPSSARLGWFSLERGMALGFVVLIGGIGLLAAVAVRWWSVDFAPLSRADHGLVVVGLTASVVGLQTVFASFFLTMIGGERPSSAT